MSPYILAGEGLAEGGGAMQTDIRAVKARHAADLLARPGVVSVGIGLDGDGREAIIVGVDRAARIDALQLPESLEGVPLAVQVVGELRAD